jgi:hypothetical protein
MEAATTAVPVSAADARLRRGLALLERYRMVLAAASFGLGAGSFLLVQHGQALAQWIALLLVLNWLLIVSENTIGQRLARYRWARFSPVVLRYAMQAVHQQTFFFCLPFLFATTTWGSGQAVFTATVIAAALISMWDPLYYGVIAPSPTLHLALHALAMYLAMLTVPPLLWQLTTTQSLGLASVTIAVLSLPSLARLIARRSLRGWALLLAAGAALGLFSWVLRAWVPPATLRLTQGIITTDVDPDARAPRNILQQVPEATLRSNGLCAFTAISAPRGLSERVYHRWLHRGHEVTRIALPLSGGREDGYRAWSCKQVFPEDASGSWAVQVVTDAGQLIGVVRFEVTGDDAGK